MRRKIKLRDNHKRVISVVLKRVENDIDEISSLLDYLPDETTYKVTGRLSTEVLENKKKALARIKLTVAKIFAKYDLRKDEMDLSKIVNAKKATLWSMLEDTYSKKLNRYGEFNKEHATEFDADITELIDLIEKI